MKDKNLDAQPDEDLSLDEVQPPSEGFTEYEQLKRLLMHDELARVAELERKLAEPDEHAPLLGRDLPRAIRETSAGGKRLSQALSPTVEGILHNSVRSDPRSMADALYPVMGPSIRRSISEALRGMVQSFNEVLSHSFSWQGFKWRLEAMRTKKSFAEVVLLHSLVYRVEQCFLIHHETGLVLQHISAEEVDHQDADMVSAMLTAIQDFVKDSFSTGDDALDSLQIGELRIIIEKSPEAIIALVVRGLPPIELADVSREALETIQDEMREPLVNFEGDAAIFETVRPILVDCMRARYHEKENVRPLAFVGVAVLFLLLMIGGLYYLNMLRSEKAAAWDGFVAQLEDAPGIAVTSEGTTEGDGETTYFVRGLRDPLAEAPGKIWHVSEVKDWDVRLEFQPYQSMESQFVLSRAKVALNPPKSVSISMDAGVLKVRGQASKGWQVRSRTIVRALAGLSGYDDSGLETLEQLEFGELSAEVENLWVEFAEGGVTPLNPEVIGIVSDKALRLQKLSSLLENNFLFMMTGRTDPTGRAEQNKTLRVRRAERVRGLLKKHGVNMDILKVRANQTEGGVAVLHPERSSRRVDFTIGAVSTKPLPLDLSGRTGDMQ